jgi:hypothetical protein
MLTSNFRRRAASALIALSAFAVVAGGIVIMTIGRHSEAREEQETDGPDKAFAWRMLAWRSEDGSIKPGGLEAALAHMNLLQQRRKKSAGSDSWVERGPYNVTGRTRSFVIDPRDSNRMFMGSVGGGIWISTDGGSNWAPVDDHMGNLAIGSMAIDPNNPDIMYAGTGEGMFNSDAIEGSGAYKSTDGGLTWNVLPATTAFGNWNRIVVSPSNSNILLGATQYEGIRRSTDGGATWSTPHWAQLAHQVLFDPTNGSKAVATVMDYDFGRSVWFTRALYSTDGGASWTDSNLTADGSGRIEVAYAPGNTNIVYASVSWNGGKIYKSTNGGVSYSLVSASGQTTGASWYCNSLFVDPSNSNRLIVTGTHTWRSTDGGVNVTQISNGYILTNDVHPDVHAAIPDPGFNGTSNNTLYVCTDGGVHKTTDCWSAAVGSGWVKLTMNARTAQFYGAVGDGPTGRILAGAQDNGTLQMEGGSNNAFYPFGGDGGWCAMDPNDPNYTYGEYIYLLIWRSTTGGNGSYIYSGISDAGGNANFIAPFVLSPSNPDVMFAGGYSLWRSTNVKATTPSWSAIKSGNTAYISAVAVSPTDPNIVWVGQNDGRVFRTANALAASPSWTTIDDNSGTNPLPNRYIGRILIDPADNSKAYVALGGFNADNFWRTTNNGSSFSSLAGSGGTALPAAPIRAIARDPLSATHLFVGTEVGVCESIDGGSTWSASSNGPVNVSVDELRYMNNSNTKLIAATHGRGVWILGPSGLASLTGASHVASGGTESVTVTLDGIASVGGVNVSMTSDNTSLLNPPANVVVPEGSSSMSFDIVAGTTSSSQDVHLTATVNGVSKNLTVTVDGSGPALINKVKLTALSVTGGTSAVSNLKVVLNAPAVAGGQVINLTSSNPSVASVPATLTINEGAKTGKAPITDFPVTSDTDVTLTASVGSEHVSVTFTVKAPRPVKVAINPASVVGGSGATVTGKVSLSGPAPAGGATVALTVNNAAASAPSSVVVPEGATFVTFNVTHVSVKTQKSPGIKATLNGGSATGQLTLLPPQAKSLTLSQNSVVGSAGTVVTGTVTINAPAPTGGVTVTLTSSDPSAASVPATVTIPVGATTANFTVSHFAVATQKIVTLTASAGGVDKTRTLTVNP